MKKLFTTIFTMILVGALLAGNCGIALADEADATEGESYELIFTSGMETTHPLTMGIDYFGKLLEERTGGRITYELYDTASLGTDAELVEQCATGLIAAHVTATNLVANYSPSLSVFDLPYIFENEDVAMEVMHSDIWDSEMAKLEGTGIKVLAPFKLGWRNVTNSVRPIVTPEDMEGIKIRVMENPVMISMFEAVGAIPTPMAWSEVYTALQQGIIDGEENPTYVVLNNNLDEVQPYISLTEHTYSCACLMFNEDLFNSMSPEDQQLILDCAKEASEWQIPVAIEREEAAVDTMNERGHTEIITEIDKEPWIEAMRSIYPDFYDTIGEDLINSVLNYNK